MGQTVIVIDGAATAPWALPAAAEAVHVIAFADLTLATLKRHLPDCIVLPLFSAEFDAMDVLARLAQFGFAGPVLVTTPDLPKPALVARELAAAAPGMTVTLVECPDQPDRSR